MTRRYRCRACGALIDTQIIYGPTKRPRGRFAVSFAEPIGVRVVDGDRRLRFPPPHRCRAGEPPMPRATVTPPRAAP